MQLGQESPEAVASEETGHPRRNIFVRGLHWYWGKRDGAEKGSPVSRTFVAIVLVALGVGASELYQWGKSRLLGPDEFLVQIKEEQDKSFEKLQDSLKALNSAMDGGNREALTQVKGAVDEIKHLNNSLISRLSLAKSENERLAKAVGVPGGLDLILSRDSGLSLDALSHVGVQGIQSNGAYVSVASKEGSTAPTFLRSGESISYTGASGGRCRVTLVSVDPRSAVSLASRCA